MYYGFSLSLPLLLDVRNIYFDLFIPSLFILVGIVLIVASLMVRFLWSGVFVVF